MVTLTLEYDGRSAKAKKAIEYILSLGVFKKKQEETKLCNTPLEDSISTALNELNKGETKELRTLWNAL